MNAQTTDVVELRNLTSLRGGGGAVEIDLIRLSPLKIDEMEAA